MTRDLGPTARSLLASARQGLAPDVATAARVRARVDHAVALGGGVALALKVVAVLALAGAATTIGLAARHHQMTASAPVIALSSAREPDERAYRVRSSAVEPALPAVAAAAPPTRAVAAVEAPNLAREVELVDRAMTALRDGDAEAALAAIADYDRETAGRGQLAEDAAAIAIEARCARNEPVADLLDRFDHRWPGSAQRARLVAACPP